MLPANVDDPRFAAAEDEPARPAPWTAPSALAAEVTETIGVGPDGARWFVADMLRELLVALISALLRR